MRTVRRITAATVLVMLAGLMLAGFAESTLHGAEPATYHIGLDGAAWIGDGQNVAPRSWFRLSVPIANRPAAATLWVDAEQAVHIAVDGNEIMNNEVDVPFHRRRVIGVSLASLFTPGAHGLGISVINYDRGHPSLLRARLTVTTDGVTRTYLTGSAPWHVTSDATAAYTASPIDDSGYSQAGFTESRWTGARVWTAPRGDVGSDFPEWVFAAPPSGQVIASPDTGSTLTASTQLHIDGGNDAWLRVAASGPITLRVNGSTVVEGLHPGLRYKVPQPDGRGVPVASLLHLSSVLRSGDNQLTVTVRSATRPTLWLDGRLGDSAAQGIATDGSWLLANGHPTTSLGTPMASWGTVPPFTSVPSTTLIPPPYVTVIPELLGVALALAAWLLLGVMGARMAGRPLADHLVMGAAGTAPVSALVAATEQLGRLPSFDAPGVHRPWVLLVLLVLMAASAAMPVVVLIPGLARALPGWARVASQALARPRQVLSLATATAGSATRAMPAIRGGFGGGGSQFVATRAAGIVTRGRRLGLSWPMAAVIATALGTGAAFTYRLGYEALWQDELFSLAAARAVRQHLIPTWPSGFQYWKSELYTALIAVVGEVFGDNPVALRMVSIIFFVLTVLAFGLVLAPRLLGTRRPWLIAGATLIFATMPQETQWANQVRMYQMAQLFIVLFLAAFWQALRTGGTRSIVATFGLLIAMYFSHEETFIFLPAAAVVGLCVLRARAVLDRRWLFGGVVAAVVIGGQYLLSVVTHPPLLGYDLSNRPFVQLATDDPFYYLTNVYFAAPGKTSSLAIVSGFAIIATITGLARRCPVRLYLAAFVWITVATMSLVFTQRYPRYVFITLPAFLLLGVLGVVDVVSILRRLLSGGRDSGAAEHTLRRSASLAFAALLLTMSLAMLPDVESLGLAATQATNSPQTAARLDYDYTAQYIRLHQQPGDLVMAHAPPNIIAEYLGRPPDYILQPRISQRLLYVFEKNGRPVDTQYGVPMVLSADDLTRVMEGHHRIWLVSDTAHSFVGLPPGFNQLIMLRFRMVAAGAKAQLYLFSE